MKKSAWVAIVTGIILNLSFDSRAADGGKLGETSVLKWKDGKRAVFLMAFDDGCESHRKTAIPLLNQYDMVGTFYVNQGAQQYRNASAVWEQELPTNPAMVYGNHTFTHAGATNAAQLDVELSRSAVAIQTCYPKRKQPFLVSFGRPGGVPWKVTEEEKKAALTKYHLIERPAFFSYPFHVKTTEEVVGLVDKAIAKGDMGHLDFHGVGGDWLVTPTDMFTALLNKLVDCRDQIWVTDHITYHKYLTERDGAQVKVIQADKEQIRIQLSSQASQELYDTELTLETCVPPEWKTCQVEQGTLRSEHPVINGVVRYGSVPGAGVIALRQK
jgi:peptidoglycan/xylan/chitin deacetylase (PgdA/CDA1 family)